MLFQGQEFASSAPFLFFADHREDLREAIAVGRREFLSQFPSIADPDVQAALPPPGDPEHVRALQARSRRARAHAEAYALHRDLLRLRRRIRHRGRVHGRIEGAVLIPRDLRAPLRAWRRNDRLLIVNLGFESDCPRAGAAAGAAVGCRWILEWSSEAVRYGGTGRAPVRSDDGWQLPGRSGSPAPRGTTVRRAIGCRRWRLISYA